MLSIHNKKMTFLLYNILVDKGWSFQNQWRNFMKMDSLKERNTKVERFCICEMREKKKKRMDNILKNFLSQSEELFE